MGDKISVAQGGRGRRRRGGPGTLEPITDVDEIVAFGDEFGWPVAIKAAYGGGGKGMKVVDGPDKAQSALDSAAREAQAYFGRSEAYLERYLTRPRHIEIQVFSDTPRQRGLARRARLLDAAPAPEAHRGVARPPGLTDETRDRDGRSRGEGRARRAAT